MTESERRKWMQTFGYSTEWRVLGLLTDDVLQAQAAAWQLPDADPCAEHYRHGTWRTYLETLEALPPPLLAALLALDLHEAGLASSPFGSFGHSIAFGLARHPALTLEGLALLRRHSLEAPSFTRLLDRAAARLNHTSTG